VRSRERWVIDQESRKAGDFGRNPMKGKAERSRGFLFAGRRRKKDVVVPGRK